MLTLADLWQGVTGQEITPGWLESVQLDGVVIDSRQATPSSLFVALRGERHHGHAFVADVFSRGAVVALVEREMDFGCPVVDARGPLPQVPDSHPGLPMCVLVEDTLRALQDFAAHWRGKHTPRVIGVTGSVGKTTTKEMIWAVLKQRSETLKSPGNLNNEIGLPLTLLQLDFGHQRVVLEMGGAYEPGEIALLARIARPQVGVVTNVGPVHLERMGSIERIAQTKAELVQALPTDGVAILNRDDPLVYPMAEQTPAQVFFYGLDHRSDLWADEIESEGLEGIRFQLHYGDERLHLKIPLLGRHSIHTALRATAVGLVEELSWEEIVAGLHDVSAHLRLVAVSGVSGSTIIDDTYNASPASTIAALNLLADLPGRRIAVLGDMLELGDYEDEGHRKVARRAVDVANKLITVGRRGRIIGEEALVCGMAAGDVQIMGNNEQAIAQLRHIVEAGDVILVKGSRGMRMEEIVNALSQMTSPEAGRRDE